MIRALSLTIAGLALVPLAQPAPAAPPTITKREVRSDPPRVTHQRLREVVWAMFEREDLRRDKEPLNPLDSLFLQTKARGTDVPGLCRYDTVHVELAPLDQSRLGADTPVAAVGLTARSNFAFLDPPADPSDGTDGDLPRASDDECRQLKKKDSSSFFDARDEHLADKGYRAWLALRKALAEKRSVPLDCDLFPSEKSGCTAVILAFDADALHSVEPCDSPGTDTHCYRIGVGDRELSLFVTGQVYPGPPPGQIVRAKLETMIVMWHERID